MGNSDSIYHPRRNRDLFLSGEERDRGIDVHLHQQPALENQDPLAAICRGNWGGNCPSVFALCDYGSNRFMWLQSKQ